MTKHTHTHTHTHTHNQHGFHRKEDIQMANKLHQVTQEMQVTTRRCYSIPNSQAGVTTSHRSECWWECGEVVTFLSCGVNANGCTLGEEPCHEPNVCVPPKQHIGVQPSIRRHSIWEPWGHEGVALMTEISALTWRMQKPLALSATANQADTPPGTTCASTLITDVQPPELWEITSVAQPIQSTVSCDTSPS